MYYSKFQISLCEVILAGDESGLKFLHLNTKDTKREFKISEDWVFNDDFFYDTKNQLIEYFNGDRKEFKIKINPEGTLFQKKVWNRLKQIPYGQVCSYKDIARGIGNEKASRAVGMANSKNPIPLIIPCHRVIGSNGKLTGFAHGLKIKERLIRLEKGNFSLK